MVTAKGQQNISLYPFGLMENLAAQNFRLHAISVTDETPNRQLVCLVSHNIFGFHQCQNNSELTQFAHPFSNRGWESFL